MRSIIYLSVFFSVLCCFAACEYDKEEDETTTTTGGSDPNNVNTDTSSSNGGPVAFCDTAKLSYTADILPIINGNCATTGCHAGDPSYTTYSAFKVKVDNGTLRKEVVIDKRMPFGGFANPDGYTDKELRELIDCWISKGAPEN